MPLHWEYELQIVGRFSLTPAVSRQLATGPLALRRYTLCEGEETMLFQDWSQQPSSLLGVAASSGGRKQTEAEPGFQPLSVKKLSCFAVSPLTFLLRQELTYPRLVSNSLCSQG